jgi:hypothetical protein
VIEAASGTCFGRAVESVAELSCLVRRQPEADIGQRLTGFPFD